jgi:TonB family protein
VAVVAIAIAGLMLRPSAGGRGPVSTEASAAERTTASGVTAAATGSAATGAAAALQADSQRSASVTSTPKAQVVQAERRAPESAPAQAEPTTPSVPFRQLHVNIPTIAATNVDSIVRSSTKRRESYTDKLGTGVGLPRVANADDALASPPTIIGRAPLPRFPDELRSTQPEGEVIVRFKVDEHGHVDVASMTVVKSDNELFTTAVRNILPRFRFEPARSPAPESKPVAVWVNLPFKFTANN